LTGRSSSEPRWSSPGQSPRKFPRILFGGEGTRASCFFFNVVLFFCAVECGRSAVQQRLGRLEVSEYYGEWTARGGQSHHHQSPYCVMEVIPSMETSPHSLGVRYKWRQSPSSPRASPPPPNPSPVPDYNLCPQGRVGARRLHSMGRRRGGMLDPCRARLARRENWRLALKAASMFWAVVVSSGLKSHIRHGSDVLARCPRGKARPPNSLDYIKNTQNNI